MYCCKCTQNTKCQHQELEADICCYFCNIVHPDHDQMNGISESILRLEASEWNEYYDCMDWVSLEVKYCPMCGRNLEPIK